MGVLHGDDCFGFTTSFWVLLVRCWLLCGGWLGWLTFWFWWDFGGPLVSRVWSDFRFVGFLALGLLGGWGGL